jgi:hypothetical protein
MPPHKGAGHSNDSRGLLPAPETPSRLTCGGDASARRSLPRVVAIVDRTVIVPGIHRRDTDLAEPTGCLQMALDRLGVVRRRRAFGAMCHDGSGQLIQRPDRVEEFLGSRMAASA